MKDNSKTTTTEETARRLVAKLHNHTVSDYNIRIIVEALDEAYEAGLNADGNKEAACLTKQ